MKYTLTLSRWHKVTERINAALKDSEATIRTAYTDTTISPWNKADIEAKVTAIGDRALEELDRFAAGAKAVATIRTMLARRNAELGISDRLAAADAANRRAAIYKSVLDGQKVDMVRPEDVPALPAELIGETGSWGLGRRTSHTVTLQVADSALIESLREKFASEKAQATRLLDEVADLNRDKIEIDLAQEVIGIAGLAG